MAAVDASSAAGERGAAAAPARQPDHSSGVLKGSSTIVVSGQSGGRALRVILRPVFYLVPSMRGSLSLSPSSSSSFPFSLLSPLRDWSREVRFNHELLPLTSFAAPAVTITLYLLIVFGIQRLMRTRKELDLKKFVVLYNFALSLISALLFAVLALELVLQFRARGFVDLFCDPGSKHSSGLIVACYFVNYLLKYVELSDTVLLVLRKKPTPFIHVYHHAVTLLLCWTQLKVQTCMQWVIIVINLFVHIFLYTYYALHELGHRPFWKRYLTSLQIVQFMIGLAASLGAMMIRVMYEVGLLPGRWYACTGSWSGSYFGLAVIVSYLYLFVQLYKDRYKEEGGAGGGQGNKATTMFRSQLPSPARTGSHARGHSGNVRAVLQFGDGSEDPYAALRLTWSNHPLLVADRQRWTVFEAVLQKQQQTASSELTHDGDEEESSSRSSSTLHQRFGAAAVGRL